MTDTLLRQWAMLRHIPRHPNKTDATRLKRQLEADGYDISLRSIQRDLVKLSRTLPLMADEAKPQGWWWQAGAAQLDLPALDPQAALTFTLVQSYMQRLLPATTLDYLQPWFQTAHGVLEAHGNGLAKWPDKICVLTRGLALSPPSIDPAAQAALYQALLQERQAAVTYQPRGAEATKDYVLHPLALVVREQIIYLVCTMWDYRDIRHLALHRLRSVQVLDEPLVRPVAFDLDAYVAQGEFGYLKGDGPVRLELDFRRKAIAHLRECALSTDQTITDLGDDWFRVAATVMDTAELRWWLLGYGDQIKVIAPASLRQEFAEIAQSLVRHYAESC
jgi:predicted DNA-binding transcriptional regulator YafY